MDIMKMLQAEKTGRESVKLFFFSPYTTEYNPDGWLNSDLKRGIGKRPCSRDNAELVHNVRSHLKSVQLRSHKARGFFDSGTTAYVA